MRIPVQFRALKSDNYRRYWLGSLASIGGTQLLILGKGWLVFELSGSPFYLGLLGAASAVPSILVTLFGGILADRVDKRRLLMITSLSTAALLLLLAVLDATEVVAVWHVIAIAALISLISGLDWPARLALYPTLIEREQMMSAVALNSMLWQGTRMILPAIGGVVIAISDTSVIFAAAALGFGFMFYVLTSLDVKHVARKQGKRLVEFLEGLRFIADHQLFASLILLTMTGMFFGTSFIQLMPVFADLLGSSEKGYGALISASGIGSITGTLVVSAFQRATRLGWILLVGMTLSTCTLLSLGLVTHLAASIPSAFYIALGLMYVIGFFNSTFFISSMTAMQLRVPEGLRGRVMSIHSISFNMISLGALVGGAVAAASTLPTAVAAGGSLVLCAIVWIAMTKSEIRNLNGKELELDR
ncbi:MAG: MFS transporter [Gammaproteobacteria bacterium]|nr:MFS transporter [Gammaproteobacteria bacterium]MDH3466093.1 MFS transporter [Gammaproteobacteria bacterium]